METREDTRRNVASIIIPHDIVFDILTKLPVKSLSRFRSVSQLWNSTISDHRFLTSHQFHTSTRRDRTTLLIKFPDGFNWRLLLFSAVRPHEQDYSVTTLHLPLPPYEFLSSYISEPLNGLICLDSGESLRVCNPSTHDFITLPPTKFGTLPSPSSSYYFSMNSFGFDPINNKHKVLNTCVISTGDPQNEFLMEHRVFTLGGNSWRRIGDGPPHVPKVQGVCIDGIIYYRGRTTMATPPRGGEIMVAFDVRAETFLIIRFPGGFFFKRGNSALISCDNHLAVVDYQHLIYGSSIDLWVLEGFQKEVWVRKSIVLPSIWREMRGDQNFYLAGTIHSTGEIILTPRSLEKPFSVIYVDMKRNSVRRIEIQGLPDYESRFSNVCFNISATNHVESILSLSDLNH